MAAVYLTNAFDVIQQDLPASLAKLGKEVKGVRLWGAKLATHHVRVLDVPLVVTDRSPLALPVHLHAALPPVVGAHQPYGGL